MKQYNILAKLSGKYVAILQLQSISNQINISENDLLILILTQ